MADGYKYHRMFLSIGIIIQVVDPDAMNRTHFGDQLSHTRNRQSIFHQCILQPWFIDVELINIFDGVSDDLQRNKIKRPVRKENGKMFLLVNVLI